MTQRSYIQYSSHSVLTPEKKSLSLVKITVSIQELKEYKDVCTMKHLGAGLQGWIIFAEGGVVLATDQMGQVQHHCQFTEETF